MYVMLKVPSITMDTTITSISLVYEKDFKFIFHPRNHINNRIITLKKINQSKYELNNFFVCYDYIFRIMRIFGLLPIQYNDLEPEIDKKGYIILYSVIIYSVAVFCSILFYMNQLKDFLTPSSLFNDNVFLISRLVLATPLVLFPYTHWCYANKILQHRTKWKLFLVRYKNLTGFIPKIGCGLILKQYLAIIILMWITISVFIKFVPLRNHYFCILISIHVLMSTITIVLWILSCRTLSIVAKDLIKHLEIMRNKNNVYNLNSYLNLWLELCDVCSNTGTCLSPMLALRLFIFYSNAIVTCFASSNIIYTITVDGIKSLMCIGLPLCTLTFEGFYCYIICHLSDRAAKLVGKRIQKSFLKFNYGIYPRIHVSQVDLFIRCFKINPASIKIMEFVNINKQFLLKMAYTIFAYLAVLKQFQVKS